MKVIIVLLASLLLGGCSLLESKTAPSSRQTLTDAEVIRSILRTAIPAIQDCHQAEKLESMVLKFVIIASGAVEDVKITQSSLSDKSKLCLEKVIQNLRFPKPLKGGRVDVSQPFKFHPAK